MFPRSYHIIVMEGSSSAKSPEEWLPSELGPYDVSTYSAGKPYVTAVLSSYVPKFSIGDGKEYSLSTRKRRGIGTTIYKNVRLKANTEYIVFHRAFISQVAMNSKNIPKRHSNLLLNFLYYRRTDDVELS